MHRPDMVMISYRQSRSAALTLFQPSTFMSPADGIRPDNRRRSSWRALPASIWALGFGSLFMDMSSELIHSLLPLFMVSALGASMVTVGVVEGIAEATAAVTKVFSGVLSDALGRRKGLMISGYALAALTKPIFPLADSVGWVLTARFVDRIGKGIRGAPRDALVADIVPSPLRGAAYGLRQALDSVGALLGPALAVGLLFLFSDNLRAAMWVAVVPAMIAVALLWVYVREPERTVEAQAAIRPPLRWSDAGRLPGIYWWVVGLGALFTLARFSEAFLVLRAQDVGLRMGWIPVVMVVMNIFYSLGAYPVGAAADRLGHRGLLLTGLALLVAADLTLAAAHTPWAVFAGSALWGLHMAFTQSLFSKRVADTVPRDLLGTGFGVFNLASGVAMLLASVIAGGMWQFGGASATFLAGALFAGLTAALLWVRPL